jgi:molybdate transport system permease protein
MEWEPLWLSFQVAAVATAISAVIGVAIAAALTAYRFPGRDIVDAVITLPLVLPPTVLGYYLLIALGRRSFLGQAWEGLTGSSLTFTVTGLYVATTVGALPLVIRGARAALEGVDRTLPQAARTLGASRLRAFFTVTLPIASPGIFAGMMLAFAKALGDYGTVLMVAGDIPGETRTASMAVMNLWFGRRGGEAAGMVAVLTAIALVVLYSVNKLTRRGHDAA